MASSTDLIVTMQSAQTYLYQFGGPIFIFIGTIGSVLNLIVFTQKNLRKNPCSIYFIAYNAANFVYIYSSLLYFTLYLGFDIDPSAYNLPACRFRLYMAFLFSSLVPFYLILASIDRILVTSPNALTRRRSTRRRAYLCIIILTLFWALFHIHAILSATIVQFGPNIFVCYYQSGVYFAFISYYSLIEQVTAVSLMTICGLWSIQNIKNIRRVRAAPSLSVSRAGIEGNAHGTSSKDRQLILMLFMDIGIYTLFSFALVIVLMYQQITQDYMKSVEQMEIEGIVRNICLFSAGIPYCISCYGNVIVSKTFRKEVKKAFSWNRIFCIH